MEPDFVLYYWPLPFRGHFIRYVLAHAGVRWQDAPVEEMMALRRAPVAEQPVPFMAPPLLHDRRADVWLSQMPAIMTWLGEKFALFPGEPAADAQTLKLLGDVTDVLEELTCNCGRTMWTQAAWDDFTAERLPRWMSIFEETGRRNGLTEAGGHLFGTPQPTLGDLATAALWFTLTDKLPALSPLLHRHAPAVAALSRRIAETPAIAAMRRDCDARWGTAYCGGQIEASLRQVTGGA